MGPLTPRAALAAFLLAGCSPEATRTRDGGVGADPGNKVLVEPASRIEPRAADTTLWPGRAPAPVERLARGQVPPATFPAGGTTPTRQQRTFDGDPGADPREPSGGER